MSTWPQLDAATDAARAGDEDTLRALIDWSLSGITVVTTALPDVMEPDRAVVAAAGLAELDAAATDPDVVALVLPPIIEALAGAVATRPATPDEREVVLDRLRIGPVPDGLTPAQLERIDELRSRADRLSDVYVVEHPGDDLPVARAADTGRLVVILD
jgi:hypothetical protein